MDSTGTFFCSSSFIELRDIRVTISSELMRDYSSVRVTHVKKVFLHCGVDYVGPIPVRMNPGRVHKSTKSHVALFYLHSKSRRAHQIGRLLYNVYAFLACYDRFGFRRSLRIAIYSDNGTSF